MHELVDLYQKILKPFNKFAVRVLSSLQHSAAPRVLNLIKHCCSFIKHYTKHGLLCRKINFKVSLRLIQCKRSKCYYKKAFKDATSRGFRRFLVLTVLKLTHVKHYLWTSKGRHDLIADRNQTKAINIAFLAARGNNLKRLALIFQVPIHFHLSHLQPKMLNKSFSALI